jgi:hypothetical protein
VRFASRADTVVVVRNYRSESCDGETEWMRLRAGPLLVSHPKRMGMPLWDFHDNGAREVFVAASSQSYFMFFGDVGSMSCAVPVVVELQAGNDYELLFDDCRVAYSRLVGEGTYPVRRQLLQHFQPRGNSGCKEAFEQTRFF